MARKIANLSIGLTASTSGLVRSMSLAGKSIRQLGRKSSAAVGGVKVLSSSLGRGARSAAMFAASMSKLAVGRIVGSIRSVGMSIAGLINPLNLARRAIGMVSASFVSLMNVFGLAGALSIGGLFAAVGLAGRRAAADIDRTAKTAAKLGISIERIPALELAGDLSGVADMGTAIQRFTRRLAEAKNGSGELKGVLDTLGLDAATLLAGGPEKALEAFADATKGLPQPERIRMFFKAFDTEGVGLVNTLKNGSAGLKDIQNEAKRLGLILDADATARVERMNDSLTMLKASIQGLARQFVANFAPVITVAAQRITEFISTTFSGGDAARSLTGALTAFSQVAVQGFNIAVSGAQSLIMGMEAAAKATLELASSVVDAFKQGVVQFEGFIHMIEGLQEMTGIDIGIRGDGVRSFLSGLDKAKDGINDIAKGIDFSGVAEGLESFKLDDPKKSIEDFWRDVAKEAATKGEEIKGTAADVKAAVKEAMEFPEALELGSAGAFDAVLRNVKGGIQRIADDEKRRRAAAAAAIPGAAAAGDAGATRREKILEGIKRSMEFMNELLSRGVPITPADF